MGWTNGINFPNPLFFKSKEAKKRTFAPNGPFAGLDMTSYLLQESFKIIILTDFSRTSEYYLINASIYIYI